MITFKQKLYVGILGGLVSAATVASVPLTMVQMVQGSKQAKEQEDQANQQQQVMKEQNDLMRKQNQKLDEIRKASPNVAAVAAQALQKSYSATDAASNFLKAGKSVFGNNIVNNVASGAAAGIGAYGAGKYIQKDLEEREKTGKSSGLGTGTKLLGGAAATGLALLGAKKGYLTNSARLAVSKATANLGKAVGSNTLMRSGYKDYNKGLLKKLTSKANKGLEKGAVLSDEAMSKLKGDAAKRSMEKLGLTGSNLAKSKGTVGKTVDFLSKNKGGILMGGVFAAPPVVSYLSERSQQNNQVQKTYSFLNTAKEYWKNSKYLPGRKFLGTMADFSSFGVLGDKNTQRFGNALVNLGKGKGKGIVNDATVKVGEWIKKNPKYTNAAAIIPGVGVTAATFDLPEKIVNKVGNKVDPKAYRYQNSINQQV